MTLQEEIQKLIDNYDSTTPIDDPCSHCQITKDILKVFEKWAIEKRAIYDKKREVVKRDDPNNIANLIVLGTKVKAFQNVIDKCQYHEVKKKKGETE